MTTTRNSNTGSRRMHVITAVSVAAVALFGAFAVSANIGILNGTQSNKVGSLATADLTGAGTLPQVVNVQLESAPPISAGVTSPASAAAPSPGERLPAGSQEFTVDAAGTVAVSTSGGMVRLDLVQPASGWAWSLVQPKPNDLKVTFTNGSRTLEFAAALRADGSVDAGVSEPTVVAAPATRPASGEQEYEGGGDDD